MSKCLVFSSLLEPKYLAFASRLCTIADFRLVTANCGDLVCGVFKSMLHSILYVSCWFHITEIIHHLFGKMLVLLYIGLCTFIALGVKKVDDMDFIYLFLKKKSFNVQSEKAGPISTKMENKTAEQRLIRKPTGA